MSSESTAPAATKLITINDDDYRSTVTLQNLKKPDFKILLERLQNHADWKGLFPNDTAIDEWKDLKFWDPFISSTIEIIQECVANRDISKAKIRSLQRDLVQKEETLIENFSRENTSKIDPNHRRLAVLQMICRTLMDLLKEDMCKGVTNKISEVNIIIENAFTSSDTDVASLFPSERLLQSIYYVAGWHLGTVLKASTRRADFIFKAECKLDVAKRDYYAF
ncbi:predicted protein [Chaetoceros tenuissimus]|uniref:Uncharacterized protein n=1 Tax=Chaetoceros tenuissimus TaxID=426638 RepID=A0AAD3HCF0_9STRA|nr:predicted protein [Chaetoceros tenuissimus]